MHELKYYPHPCELDALRDAAIEACDCKDGLIDGIITDPASCAFDPYSIVGQALNCTSSDAPGAPKTISKQAAAVADAVWNGAKGAKGEFLWYTPGPQAQITGPSSIAATDCSTGTCSAVPLTVFTDWIRYFIFKDENTYYGSNFSRAEFHSLYEQGAHEYASILGTEQANLKDFREAGGKSFCGFQAAWETT